MGSMARDRIDPPSGPFDVHGPGVLDIRCDREAQNGANDQNSPHPQDRFKYAHFCLPGATLPTLPLSSVVIGGHSAAAICP